MKKSHAHSHRKEHQHAHGHAHDQGWSGFLRYARMFPRMWKSDVSAAVVELVAPKPGEHLVEIGSGMGAGTVIAARSGATVLAVDPTPYMRRILMLRSAAQIGPLQISVVNGAAEAISAADGSADAVWSVNTMHHWTDIDGALAEIHRVLRPGGRLVLVDEDFDDPSHPSHEEFTQRHAKHGHAFTEIVPAQFAEKLQTLGFSSASGSFQQIAGRPAKVIRGARE